MVALFCAQKDVLCPQSWAHFYGDWHQKSTTYRRKMQICLPNCRKFSQTIYLFVNIVYNIFNNGAV